MHPVVFYKFYFAKHIFLIQKIFIDTFKFVLLNLMHFHNGFYTLREKSILNGLDKTIRKRKKKKEIYISTCKSEDSWWSALKHKVPRTINEPFSKTVIHKTSIIENPFPVPRHYLGQSCVGF